MSAPTVLCVGDVHLSDRPPSNCHESYNEDLFGMLDEIVSVANARRVSAVAFSGDLFHRKAPTRTSHRTVARVIALLGEFDAPVYIVPGNHDLTHDRIESLAAQPLGVVFESGVARMLDGWAYSSMLPLYGVPWQQDWDHASPAFAAWCGAARAGRERALLVTHAPLYPPGRELPWENIPAATVAGWMSGAGAVYYGHVHPRHGTFVKDGVTFCNQGAISRGSLHEEDVNRDPAVTIWHGDVVGETAFERVELASAPPPERVFRLTEAAARDDYTERLDGFLSRLSTSQVSLHSTEALLAHVRTLGLSEGEVALADEVLAAAAAGELK